MKIAIIGSGISGMMTAWMLAGRGCDITLYDKQQPGQESSWAGGGIVSPLYPWRYADAVTRLAHASQAVYPKLVETLKSESGIDPEYLRSGLLIFSPEEEEAALAWGQRWSMDIRSVDASAIAALDPGLACPDPTALWFPDVGQVRNPRIVKALYTALQKRPDIRFMTNTEVSSLSPSPQGIEVVTGSSRKTFDKAILCAGAWSPLLLEQAGVQPEIRPVRGQMLLFRTDPGTVRRITLHGPHRTGRARSATLPRTRRGANRASLGGAPPGVTGRHPLHRQRAWHRQSLHQCRPFPQRRGACAGLGETRRRPPHGRDARYRPGTLCT